MGHEARYIAVFSLNVFCLQINNVGCILIIDKNSKLLSPHTMEMHLSGNPESEDALHVRKAICNILLLLCHYYLSMSCLS